MAENWIRTDESEDVASSLRHAIACLTLTRLDPLAWKWYALSLHAAIQGACVCHLVTTASPVGAVTKQNAEEWLTYFELTRNDSSRQPPTTYLMDLPDLLKAIRKINSAGDGSLGSDIALSDAELNWLQGFHRNIRNEFVHFSPKGWSIEVSGLPDLGRLISRVIGDIYLAGWAFRHMDSDGQHEMTRSLKALAA